MCCICEFLTEFTTPNFPKNFSCCSIFFYNVHVVLLVFFSVLLLAVISLRETISTCRSHPSTSEALTKLLASAYRPKKKRQSLRMNYVNKRKDISENQNLFMMQTKLMLHYNETSHFNLSSKYFIYYKLPLCLCRSKLFCGRLFKAERKLAIYLDLLAILFSFILPSEFCRITSMCLKMVQIYGLRLCYCFICILTKVSKCGLAHQRKFRTFWVITNLKSNRATYLYEQIRFVLALQIWFRWCVVSCILYCLYIGAPSNSTLPVVFHPNIVMAFLTKCAPLPM